MAKADAPRKRLRLVKVDYQPTFVLDDGETLTEVKPDPLVVTAPDWPDVVDRLDDMRAHLEDELNAQ